MRFLFMMVVFGWVLIPFSWADIADLSLNACAENSTRDRSETHITLTPLEEQYLCIQIQNKSSTWQYADVEIVDMVVTDDRDRRRACRDNGQNRSMSWFIRREFSPSRSVIPANSTIQLQATLFTPSSYGGEQYGCVVLSQSSQDKQWMNVVVRKAHFLTIDMTWAQHVSDRWVLSGSLDVNLSLASVTVVNSGNVQQKLNIQWSWSLWWGLWSGSISQKGVFLLPGDRWTPTMPLDFRLIKLVGWPLRIAFSITDGDDDSVLHPPLTVRNFYFFSPMRGLVLITITVLLFMLIKWIIKSLQRWYE